MSLVQSLRQYLFVHRGESSLSIVWPFSSRRPAIIQSYLGMVDEDRDRYRRRAKSESIESEAGAESGSRSSTAPLTMASTNPSSIQGTDDESHVKRRASPTDLRPGGDDGMMIHGPTGLTKRPSVKRMRAEVEGVSIPSSAPGQGGKDGPGRTRSRSKLGLEGGRASEVGQGSH